MNTKDIDALKQVALNAISTKCSIKQPILVHSATDVVPSSGKTIHLFTAVAKGKHNAPAFSIVLDESGEEVDIRKLSSSEAKTFFKPVFPKVPLEALEPSKIKIAPPKDDLTLNECDKVTETITVTIPKGAPVSKADIYFLADTTSSMGAAIAAVQAGASTILSELSTNFPGLDLAYGVGNYRDFNATDPYAFQHQLSITTITANVQTAISAWSLGNGVDPAEGQLFALDQIAQPPGGSIGWRTGSKPIIVWFGDAPGHDPVCAAISGSGPNITEATVTTKLVTEKISVIAISTDTGIPNALDADPIPFSSDYNADCGAPGGTAGQATRIAAATGGAHAVGVNPATIVTTIIDLIKAVVTFINNVSLVPDPVVMPFVTSITPAGGYGPLAGDKEHILKFEVTFTADGVTCTTKDQVFEGSLNVVVDGTVVAKKPTRITIPACKYTYSVKYVCGVQQQCECECTPVRPGVYATEINIHNYKCHEAKVEKWFIPLVFSGAPVGREPRVSKRRALDRIVLPADSATMDDCCRVTELLLGAPSSSPMPLTVGFVEIVSNVELSVTAVYTATDLKSNSLSMDVEVIESRLK